LTCIPEVFIIFAIVRRERPSYDEADKFPEGFIREFCNAREEWNGKMAEIKSAIELAMEKTKNLVIDPKEREEMVIKEIEDRIKAVLRRYAESMIGHEDAAKELERIQSDRVLKRAIIIDNLVEEFDAHKDNKRLFDLFHALGIDLPQSIRNEFETINNKFREEMKSRETVIRKNIKDVLTELNITGSAIEPNLDAWEEWHEEVRRTNTVFGKKIEELKNKVKATTKGL
jgi:hypothetical protein